MTNVEINYLCACAYFSDVRRFISIVNGSVFVEPEGTVDAIKYEPLHDGAQCFALVKRFHLNIGQLSNGCKVFTSLLKFTNGGFYEADDADLNRAICLCVATMQAGKGK